MVALFLNIKDLSECFSINYKNQLMLAIFITKYLSGSTFLKHRFKVVLCATFLICTVKCLVRAGP